MKYARNFPSAFRRVVTPVQCVLGPPYSYHPDTSTTVHLDQPAGHQPSGRAVGLPVGRESLYYDKPGIVPEACAS